MTKKEGKEHPMVFISYSHKDKEWVRNWLVLKLEAEGIQTYIDYRDFEIGVSSAVNMERAVEQCAKTIIVFSPNQVESEFTLLEGIMLQTIDPVGSKKKILPLMLEECVLPLRLKIYTYADFKDKNNWDFEIEKLIKQIKEDFSQIAKPAVRFPILAEENVDIARLPKTGYELFGRQEELKLLDEAWELDKTNVLSFVAYGGTGKSTLINKWLERMRWDNYRGAKRVYGWSFYSQGTGERATSADMFINEALKRFGDTNPTEGSEWEKGKRLAKLVREEKTLLILDGMEPLQSDVDFEKGKIKDNALAMLVAELAKENSGLCVITTREDVPDIKRYAQTAKIVNIHQISDEAGRELLKVRGIQGTDGQLEQATCEFGNHALAINLLASYLHGIAGHHISNAAEIADIDVPVDKGRHPRRVMEAFDKRFGKGAKGEILRIMGLFDRPAELKAIEAVRAAPAIAGLTEYLQKVGETQWIGLLKELRDCKLLAQESKHNPDVIDCHPLVREHFGGKLKKDRPDAWREGHGRLYEYYKGVPKKELPDTLEEMEPLFRAVYHGCAAGRYQETLDDVFLNCLDRGEAYVGRKLGAYSSTIAALSGFFARPWGSVVADLEDGEDYIMSVAGFCLRAMGRLREAVEPMEGSLQRRIEQKNWGEEARNASNLSELYLTLGEVKKAVEYGRRCVEYAAKSGDWVQVVTKRTTLADALHQAGEVEESRRLFEEAEGIQKKMQPGYRYLYSLQGYQYCDLLLAEGKVGEAKERARQTIEIARRNKWLLDMALDKLSLGRAFLAEAASKIKEQKSPREIRRISRTKSSESLRDSRGNIKIAENLNEAVDGLRKAGTQDHLPRGLLARAGYYRVTGDYKRAWGDLEEAKEIAERGEMKLWLADYHLESSRVCLDEGRKEDAKGLYEEAKRLIEECGYHRRDKELKELAERFA